MNATTRHSTRHLVRLNNIGLNEKVVPHSNDASNLEASTNDSTDNCCPNGSSHSVIHRSVRSLWQPLLLFSVLCVVSIRISSINPGTLAHYTIDLLGLPLRVSMPLFALFPAIVLGRIIALLYNDRHEVRCHHLVSISGITSFSREEVIAPFEVLLGVHVHQSIPERLINCGTIFVGTAMTDRPEILMLGIANPHHVATIIKQGIDNVCMVKTT